METLKGIINLKEAFRLLCICPVGCSSYRDISRLHSISEGLERRNDNIKINKSCDTPMDDIIEEDVSLYMDLPLTISMIAEFDDITIT